MSSCREKSYIQVKVQKNNDKQITDYWGIILEMKKKEN